jgi:hypothetical protein
MVGAVGFMGRGHSAGQLPGPDHRLRAGRGDVDTTAAILGGIVAARAGIGDGPDVAAVPHAWVRAQEALPAWAGRDDADQRSAHR